jgi:hypothetical protein
MRARTLAPVLVALAALGCGDTLIDHSSPLADPPVLSVCDVAACPALDPSLIGTPEPACLGSPGNQVCGYECKGGLLKCAEGCCKAKEVAAGARHTCAIAAPPADGDLYCWGANESGQAAPDVSSSVYAIPRKIGEGVTAVALGDAHTCAITTAGAVVCWGLASDGRLGPGGVPITASATAIAAGTAHTCAVVAGGVQCWGSDLNAQLGPGGEPFPAGSQVTAVAAGARHSCAVVAGGVQCWGAGEVGQLGDGADSGSAGPVPVSGIAGATRIVAREDYTCAGLSAGDRSLQCWGNAPGLYLPASAHHSTPAVPLRRVRNDPPEPDPVVGGAVTLLGAGRAHACVQDGAGGAVSCFGGNNGLGQLGGPPEPGDSSFDIPITTAAKALAVGEEHGCAVLPAGTVRCWGANNWGQLGNGSTIRPVVGDVVPISGR